MCYTTIETAVMCIYVHVHACACTVKSESDGMHEPEKEVSGRILITEPCGQSDSEDSEIHDFR